MKYEQKPEVLRSIDEIVDGIDKMPKSGYTSINLDNTKKLGRYGFGSEIRLESPMGKAFTEFKYTTHFFCGLVASVTLDLKLEEGQIATASTTFFHRNGSKMMLGPSKEPQTGKEYLDAVSLFVQGSKNQAGFEKCIVSARKYLKRELNL